MALNSYVEKIPLNKFGADSAIAPASTTTTYYGSEADYKRRVLAAKFYSQLAITGDTANHFDIQLWAGSDMIAQLALHTGTDHTANDYSDLTMVAENSSDTLAMVEADTTLTCSAAESGTATNLHTNSWVCVTLAPVEIF